MDKSCMDCDAPVGRGVRCKRHAAVERWRTRTTARFCKTCAGQIVSRGKARAIYCSVACKFADPELIAKIGGRPNSISKTCPACARAFEVPVCHDARFNFCSKACSVAFRGRDAECRRCGASFRHGQTSKRSYCSETCRRPPVVMCCEQCGAHFRTVPTRAHRRRYCSARCYMASGLETSIERTVRLALERGRYRAVQQAPIGAWVVDFLVGGRLVIEADGSYWHSLRPHVDRRKTADLTDRGYAVWRLSEEEIRHPEFPTAIQRRLADYEVANGQLPRAAPDEASVDERKDRMVGGYAQLALTFDA